MYLPLHHFKDYVLGTTPPAWWISMKTWEKGVFVTGMLGLYTGSFFIIGKVTKMLKSARMTPKQESILGTQFQHVVDLVAF